MLLPLISLLRPIIKPLQCQRPAINLSVGGTRATLSSILALFPPRSCRNEVPPRLTNLGHIFYYTLLFIVFMITTHYALSHFVFLLALFLFFNFVTSLVMWSVLMRFKLVLCFFLVRNLKV